MPQAKACGYDGLFQLTKVVNGYGIFSWFRLLLPLLQL